MHGWNHAPVVQCATSREQDVVNRLHHLADGPLDLDVRPVVADGVRLILDLIEARGKRRDFDEQWDRPHEEG